MVTILITYEPKWAFVRYMYGIISKDPKAPYYENITFQLAISHLKKFPVQKNFHLRVQQLFLRICDLLQIIYRIELANFLKMDVIEIFRAYL